MIAFELFDGRWGCVDDSGRIWRMGETWTVVARRWRERAGER